MGKENKSLKKLLFLCFGEVRDFLFLLRVERTALCVWLRGRYISNFTLYPLHFSL